MTHWRDHQDEEPEFDAVIDALAGWLFLVVMAVPVLAVWLIYTGWG